jgi:hypothetical protein
VNSFHIPRINPAANAINVVVSFLDPGSFLRLRLGTLTGEIEINYMNAFPTES